MTLQRILEPEVMDTAAEALEYDSMDHSEVNRLFVDDLLAEREIAGRVLDLGTGTARIPVELASRAPECYILAIDMSTHMLDLARYNIEVAGLRERIQLGHVDGKRLPYRDKSIDVVISNSIMHHIPEPSTVLAEAVRVTTAGGLIFFRDLVRPPDQRTLDQLVDTYAGDASEHQRALFVASLHAALSLPEIRSLVEKLGFPGESVQTTSDRHWTWAVTR